MKWKCEICGLIVEGDEAPEVCKVCGAPKESFKDAAIVTEGEASMKQWLCLFCGYIYETNEMPKLCPECQAKEGAFVELDKSKNQLKEAGPMWKCTSCGYIHFGEEAPEECPACEALQTAFISKTAWWKKRV